MQRLRGILRRIDGSGYQAYRQLGGQVFQFPDFTLLVDYVQADPFAPPSRLRVHLPQEVAGFCPETWTAPCRLVALRDFLVRAFAREAAEISPRRDPGSGGRMFVALPGQEVLERSACQVTPDLVEMRFFCELPAAGRRVLGDAAEEILADALPRLMEASLCYERLDQTALWLHLQTCEDADALRAQLREHGLVAFVADGSVLPRRSGVDDRPLPGGLPFQAPPSLRLTLATPNRGSVSGMGVPSGVTLITGGGFHGKSTLLRALERGVYNHVPGDGRELVVTQETAAKIRAEDGRSVVGVDISPFIGQIPGCVDTRWFTSANASGSTSQASNIVEALEAGTSVLLMDEDTSASNLLLRDRRMQSLIPKLHEPITPFVDQVRNLYKDLGVSTVMVTGGSGDYLDVADTVIAMFEYLPSDMTAKAREVASLHPTGRISEGGNHFACNLDRFPVPETLTAPKGKREVYLKVQGARTLLFGNRQIDLSHVEQLVEDGQVRAIGGALILLGKRYLDGHTSLREALPRLARDLKVDGLDTVFPFPHPPDLVAFRLLELAAALNRLRDLGVQPGGS